MPCYGPSAAPKVIHSLRPLVLGLRGLLDSRLSSMSEHFRSFPAISLVHDPTPAAGVFLPRRRIGGPRSQGLPSESAWPAVWLPRRVGNEKHLRASNSHVFEK